MDWLTHFHRARRAFPAVLMAGALCVGAGCAHRQAVHDDLSTHHADGQQSKLASAETAVSADKRIVGVDELKEAYGLEIISIRPTASGHMLDMRYRVSDPEKAHAFLRVASKVEVVVIDRSHDAVAKVPKTMLGKLRGKSALAQSDLIYYVIFSNPHQMIRSGSLVDIHIGDVAIVDWPVL